MTIKTRAIRLTGVLAACALLTLSAGFAWTVVDDYSTREVIPAGVTVAGQDLGGQTREQARQTILDTVAAPLFEPVDVIFGDRVFTLDPAKSMSMDVDTMLENAFNPKTGTTVFDRTYRKLANVSVAHEVEPLLEVEGGSLEGWVQQVASQVDTNPIDAAFYIQDDAVVMHGSTPGLKTDVEQATELITEALLGGNKRVQLPVDEVAPTVTDDDLGQTLWVDLSERTVTLYYGLVMQKSYGIAIGTPAHPTPRGTYEVTQKRYMPTWSNPGSAWAANMPAYIPPGPSNPLGTRAINISASGIRFHGTTQNWSIGRAASHGCMRMHRWDVEDLYDRVDVGARVLIVR